MGYRIDPMTGYKIWVDDTPPTPLTREQLVRLAKSIRERAGELTDTTTYDAERKKELEAKRQTRLTAEAYNSLSPEERLEFDSQYGSLAIMRRVHEQARRQADELWMELEQQRQHDELVKWRKAEAAKGRVVVREMDGSTHTREGKISTREENIKVFELDAEGREKAKQRLEQRTQRELEAEDSTLEEERLWLSMSDDEKQIFIDLMKAEPTPLERIQEFKQQNRNPIADIGSAKELYKLVNQKPVREEHLPTDVSTVEDSKTLYRMAAQNAAKRRTK